MNVVKKHLNHCQKQYKMRTTPQNKQRLGIVEDNFERAKNEAQETWSDRLVSEFNTTNNAKDVWNTFKKMTRKTEDKSVLPLMGDNNIPVFDSRNKTEMLREIFFGGKHLKHDSFFKNAGENFIKAMEVMMNIGWRKGELPSEWKTAIVKFLRKPGKSTYYSTSSYRPTSLTCIMCKLME